VACLHALQNHLTCAHAALCSEREVRTPLAWPLGRLLTAYKGHVSPTRFDEDPIYRLGDLPTWLTLLKNGPYFVLGDEWKDQRARHITGHLKNACDASASLYLEVATLYALLFGLDNPRRRLAGKRRDDKATPQKSEPGRVRRHVWFRTHYDSTGRARRGTCRMDPEHNC
jgi:hypothetical protein